MNWNVFIQATLSNPANNLVAAIYDHSAPSVPVQVIVPPKPYASTIHIIFTGVNKILYDFKLFESATTSPAGTIRSNFSFQPTQAGVTVRSDLYLIAGTSVNFSIGATSYIADSPNDLTGWAYDLERVGMGTMQPGVDYATDANGFHLLLAGDQFGAGEKFVLHFQPLVGEEQVDPPPALISSTEVITANRTLTNADVGKSFLIQGAGTNLTVILPSLSLVGDNKTLFFSSAGGNHINAIIQCAGSDAFEYKLYTNQVTAQTKIILGQSQHLMIFKANSKWNILSCSDEIKMVGEVIDQYSKQPINTLLGNGTLKSRADYAGLWAYVQTLEAGLLIADSQFNNTDVDGNFVNQAKYTTGDGSTTFRIPKLYVYGYRRAVDGSIRLPADFKTDDVKQHKHDLIVPTNKTSTTDSGVGRFVGGADGNEPSPMNTVTTENNSGTETTPKNTGIYALIRY